MREEELFHQVLDQPPEQRDAFLDAACRGDAGLRDRVHSLLLAHANPGSFLQGPADAAFAKTVTEQPVREAPGTVIGPYKLLEQIGEGGFGVVFMAEQTSPVKRKVALKVIKPGMDTRQVIARFEAERQALALMDHPHIAKVFDAGATETGRPYFVMELVKGVPITEYCDQHQLTPRERLELFVTVCQAVQHAHQKGIIHRDIKPSNVLVTLHDDQPVVKVIDFGIAKATIGQLTDKTLFTGLAQLVGTPLYMSPEQASLSAIDVDTRSDIYSLGVLLYELLTGTTPFDKSRLQRAAFDEVRRIIREEEPQKPSTRLSSLGDTLSSVSALRNSEPRKLSQLVRGDLDWIVMKALEKDRARRYETANGFAADVLRYLADEPVTACPPSAGYRFRKFARRNRAVLATVAVVGAALLLGVVGTTWQAYHALQQRDRAVEAEKEADKQRNLAQQRANEADEARARAEANSQQARQAVDDYFNTVSESRLLDMPGLEPLRKELLESALKYYQSFAEQHADDPGRQADLAVAYLRVSQIMFWNGDREDRFFPYLEQSVEILERLVREGRDTPEVQRRVAGYFRSNPDPRSFEPGNTTGPGVTLRCLERFVLIWEKFARDNPAIPEFQDDLAGLYYFTATAQGNLGTFDQALNSVGKATAIWERLAQTYPKEPRYRLNLALIHERVGAVYLGLGQREQAALQSLKSVALREQVVSEFPHVAGYRVLLGIAYRYAGELAASDDEAEQAYAKSVSEFEKVAAEFPTMRSCRQDLALGYLQLANARATLGKSAEALELYRQSALLFEALVAEAPDYAKGSSYLIEAHFNSIELLKTSGREQETAEAYRKFRESLPNDAKTLNNIAWSLVTAPVVKARDSKLAVELAQRAVELEPRAGSIWSTLGNARYYAGDWTAAITALEKSMELRNGGDSYDWFFLAMAQWQLGEHDAARTWYKAARLWAQKYQPQSVALARFRAEAAALLGLPETEPTDTTDDVSLGEALVAANPQGPSYGFRGAALATAGQWERAAEDFVKAGGLDPGNDWPWYALVLVRLAKDDKPGVQAACADMLKQFSGTEDASTAYSVAWSCALAPDSLTDYAPAVALAQSAAQKDAKSVQFAGALGAILYRAGRFDEARQILEEAERLSASTDAGGFSPTYLHFFLAMAQYRLGNSDAAQQWFDKARQETDAVLKAHENGSAQSPWNRRLTLNQLRREAEELIDLKPAPPGVEVPMKLTAPDDAQRP